MYMLKPLPVFIKKEEAELIFERILSSENSLVLLLALVYDRIKWIVDSLVEVILAFMSRKF
ncbi:hypothetical protein [Emticicia sp.]|uniref:hypothetical protein n=1 Tax=Emticicia sp. TaxID=1930953 RepID=UPI003752AFAA